MGTRPTSNVTYPPPFPQEDTVNLANASSREDIIEISSFRAKSNMVRAARAYLLGDSERVKDYEKVIDAHLFPRNVAFFASDEDFVISDEVLVEGPDPVVWNHENIIFEPGGYINATVEFEINCQTMTKNT